MTVRNEVICCKNKMLPLHMLAQVTTSEKSECHFDSSNMPQTSNDTHDMLASHHETEVCYANPCEGLNPIAKMQGLIPPLECEDLSKW